MISEQAAVLKARSRLTGLLAAISADIADQSYARCPYRTRADACTFRGECQNRVRDHRARRCTGARLDCRPAERENDG